MTTIVVVPWRGGCPHRKRAWEALRARYPWPVIEAPGPEPWCKAEAVMPAIENCPDGIVIVADADVWTDGLAAAVAAVEDGAGWAMPHTTVYRLSERGTRDFLAGKPRPYELAQRRYRGVWGGGYVVARRETLLEVPLDRRFKLWGQEDESHALALHTLAGPGWRGTADLSHCWHPPQERLTRRRGSKASWELYRQYRAARGDREAMRALLDEAASAGPLPRTKPGQEAECLSPT